MTPTRPTGTQDLLPDSGRAPLNLRAQAFEHIRSVARHVLTHAGAARIETPMFEPTDLVQRGVGDGSDIVRKEMFSVSHAGSHGDAVLRPEGTAGVMRAYLQNGLSQRPSPVRLWTDGPMFRAERPQKGRLRQFHQVDYEVIGSAEPALDAEAVALMWDVITALGLTGARIRLGSVGAPRDREDYSAYLRDMLTPHAARLSPDSQARLERSPMRILDSKDSGDQALLTELAPRPLLERLGPDARAHFDQVCSLLRAWDMPFDIDPGIVRGLDYYTQTAWEVHHGGVGAKSALGGGGRYDGLAAALGGPPTPAVGWALGIERVLIAMDTEDLDVPLTGGPLLYVAALGPEHVALAGRAARLGRAVGACELAARPIKPSAALGHALRRGARVIGLVGDNEAERAEITLKELASGRQITIPITDLPGALEALA
ncbi:histidine--tRNA ligase [Deinococcus yunweiensis]|uniref:histidine--tRNA ligase n=1 Tax=Deinococcus yunweiensis TaxID=367282 RepID=UPI00398ED9EF